MIINKTNFWNVPKQTLFRESGEGDCWRCCVAAILGLPAAAVTNFIAIKNGSMNADTNSWLLKRGFFLAHLGIGLDSFHVSMWGADDYPNFPIIECGPTLRSKQPSHTHAVVTLNGKMVYDPHPDESGLLATTERYSIIKQFAPNLDTQQPKPSSPELPEASEAPAASAGGVAAASGARNSVDI